jgi:hypothetical protein
VLAIRSKKRTYYGDLGFAELIGSWRTWLGKRAGTLIQNNSQ